MMYNSLHTYTKTRTSIFKGNYMKRHEHTKIKSMREEKKREKNEDSKKRVYDLKGKHFSCYPFLTFYFISERLYKAGFQYNTAPICLYREIKVVFFFASICCTLLFLHCVWFCYEWWSNCGRRARLLCCVRKCC